MKPFHDQCSNFWHYKPVSFSQSFTVVCTFNSRLNVRKTLAKFDEKHYRDILGSFFSGTNGKNLLNVVNWLINIIRKRIALEKQN